MSGLLLIALCFMAAMMVTLWLCAANIRTGGRIYRYEKPQPGPLVKFLYRILK